MTISPTLLDQLVRAKQQFVQVCGDFNCPGLLANIILIDSLEGYWTTGVGQNQNTLLSSPNFACVQSAYRRGHFAENSLLHIMNGIYAAASNMKATIMVSLYISAAFDTIDHDVLLSRFR